jgi:hypothetical protein
MKLLELEHLDPYQKEAVRELWNEEYPKSLVLETTQNLDDYLYKLKDQKHLLLFDEDENVMGWFFGFIRDNERWFAIIVKSSKHNMGCGTLLLEKAKSLYTELNGWVITDATHTKRDGSYYLSPLGFYLKNGFSFLENETVETDKMKAVKIRLR